jgi:hypothetical protein
VDIKSVTRSAHLGVTAMSHEPFCGLRAVWASEEFPHSLPRHPEAVLGSIIHAALRTLSHEGADAVLSLVREALSGAKGTIATAATQSGVVSLREAIPATRLSAKLAAARRFATVGSEQDVRRTEKLDHAKRGGDRPRSQYGTWREASFASEHLQLKGQMDLFRATPGRYTIIDFKSGRVASETGKLLEAYMNQIHYYAMLVEEAGYGPDCELTIIGADGSFSVPRDGGRIEVLGARLSDLLASTPRGAITGSDRIARVSEACTSCSYRPWCGSYTTMAPDLWRAAQVPFRLPMDTWGIVQRVFTDHEAPGFKMVHIVDAASRLVSITGIPTRLASEVVREGKRVGFFALKPRSTGPGHPQNFSLAVPGDLRASNHTGYVTGV